jgi:ribulose-phosphate 3-epimerase
MIEEPDRHLDAFVEAGADTIGVHVEACRHLHRTVAHIRERGARACVVLNPATPAEVVEPVLGDIDQVLVMTVNPGFGGQSFIASTLPKIERLNDWINARGLEVDLEVDGGIGPETILPAAAAGANVFVAGTAVFGSEDYGEAIASLRAKAAP